MKSSAYRRGNLSPCQGKGAMRISTLHRRDFLRSIAAGAAAVMELRPIVARAQASVKIGTAVLGDYALAGSVTIALEKGFFKAEGLDAEFIPFRGGPNLVKA